MEDHFDRLAAILDQVTGFIYPNEIEQQWGLLIVVYPYITGLVAGAFILASLEKVFNVKEVEPTYRLALLTALAFLIVAPLPLLAHLGHPERSYEILASIEYIKEGKLAARHHQERFDGTGYPSGLKGKTIPLLARIVAVADTFDAMTSSRAYRASCTAEEALEEIRRVRGSQLDPELADLFLDLCEARPEWLSGVADRRETTHV